MTERKTSDPVLQPRGEFANILLALRREFGLSQRQMAALAGKSQPEIARLETGTVSPT
jgi:predicted transcriptional regulator